MKHNLIYIFLLLSLNCFAQSEETVVPVAVSAETVETDQIKQDKDKADKKKDNKKEKNKKGKEKKEGKQAKEKEKNQKIFYCNFICDIRLNMLVRNKSGCQQFRYLGF